MENTVNKNLKNTLASGIISIVDAFFSIALAVVFFILLKTGVASSGTEGMEGVGFAFVIVIFFPLSIICFVPIALHAVYKIIFGAHLISTHSRAKRGEVKELSKPLYTASLVLRIITAVLLAIELILIYSIFDAGKVVYLGIIFAIAITLLVILQIVAIVIERKSKIERA
ncbi:MAG: hypothetical protein IJA97_06010 [Clostridia bacterium]|nr:hypothetical protein [Clostridia bacterium]